MDQVEAYAAVARELAEYGRLSFDELAQLADGPAAETRVRSGPDELMVEIRVRRLTRPPGAIRIEGTAYGPSWWKRNDWTSRSR